ncbi:MCE family protein [Conexibacter sp. W3-3-2]|uniref:MlaD family protein n=1 Tax=Conexibacter sp. W3-3-2 TaxID=2675227 RepID=UPI0012B83F4E|nr:MlaD family protein [Conexibacter sp. W3-3-2]MTD45905.1 MCE family protein [Conexibacter sp. W3-3-2]
MRVNNLRGKTLGLIAFALLCVLMFLYLYVSAGGRLRINDPYNAKALLPDTFNVVPNSDIRRNGVKIGRVNTVEPKGSLSEIRFEIEKKGQQQLYRDATVKVRTKTLVGESYIEVEPGTPSSGKLPSGSTLPLEANQESVPLERILSTIDPATRRQIRRNLRGLGGGLDGKGDELNRTFGAMKPAVASTSRLMEVLEPQRRELAALIDNTGEVLEAFGEREVAFRGLVTDAKSTAEVVAQRDARLRESISELPETLDRARTSVARLSSFAGRATPTVRDLKLASVDLAPAVRDLEPTAKSARVLFDELEPFLDRFNPLLSQLTPAAKSLSTLIRPLDTVLRQVNPTVAFLKPYGGDITAFFTNVPAIFDAKDAVGLKGRVFPVAGPQVFAGLTKEQRELLEALTKATGVDQLYNVRTNSYPKPGAIGKEASSDGSYQRVEEDK